MKHALNTAVTYSKKTDDTADDENLGKKGTVRSYNGNGQTGNTTEDPLHHVIFEDGTYGSYWYEELTQE